MLGPAAPAGAHIVGRFWLPSFRGPRPPLNKRGPWSLCGREAWCICLATFSSLSQDCLPPSLTYLFYILQRLVTEIGVVQLRIVAALGHQCLVISFLDDVPLF